MADSHDVGVYGVLLAVIVVGAAGLYFTVSDSGQSIIYVGAGNAPQITAFTPPYYNDLQDVAKPFAIVGKGVTGLSTYYEGTATISLAQTFDLRMPKNTITCEADLFQDEDAAELYTCGDDVSVGGAIICDDGGAGGTGDSITNPTNGTTCSSSQNNGAFVVANHGSVGQLTAELLNITVDGVTAEDIVLGNTLYNCSDNDADTGCVGLCNNCNLVDAQAGDCDLDLNESTATSNVTTECQFLTTSGNCVCECFIINIDNVDTIHSLKSGNELEFIVKKTIETTTITDPSGCT